MFTIRKAGLAIVMSLILSLTLLISGVSAQSIPSSQNTTGANPHMTALVAGQQSTTHPMLRVSHLHSGKVSDNYRKRRSHVRCYWTWRGWGRYRRSVRVCTRW
jgi:hypothetical protein